MDASSLAQDLAPTKEQEQAHGQLLEAAREALAWFRRFERHAPQEIRFGDEARVTRRLAEAVRVASYEVRSCPDCKAGMTHAPTTNPLERPTMVPCAQCNGTGKIRVYAYAKPQARRVR